MTPNALNLPDKLKAAANQGASSITLRVNSPGGDVFSALSMYDAIRSCKMPVRAEVHGLAASAASLLCMRRRYGSHERKR